jgi:GT2 family glycosyltransferase
MSAPKVSVLLPVFNADRYLRLAIDSILTQTFTDFELIIINDGSTDGSRQILESYVDPRIQLIHQANAGLPISLNRAIKVARGQYLARQDADDVSLPSRLSEQVHYLDAHLQCALLGTAAQIIEEDTLSQRTLSHPTDNGEIQIKLLFYNCFVHSSVMIRKAALDQSGLYPEDPNKFPPEDYDLWLRIAQHGNVNNLQKVLLHYRELPHSISRTKLELMQARARLMSLHRLQELVTESASNVDLRSLVSAMTNQVMDLNWLAYIRLGKPLKKLQSNVEHAHPNSVSGVRTAIEECRTILWSALLKSQIRSLSRILPFDLVGFLKKIK